MTADEQNAIQWPKKKKKKSSTPYNGLTFSLFVAEE